jgi:homocysteine S-methyltransferase
MRGREFLERLRQEVLLGDGAMGTMLRERGFGLDVCLERLNLTHPQVVQEIHQEYFQAGAQVLETNTFGANRTRLGDRHAAEVRDINRAAVALLREVVGQRAYVAGSVGPLAPRHLGRESLPLSDDEIRDLFREQIEALAEAGADLLMLETFSDLHQLLLALETARSCTDLPVVCMLAFHERGHTYTGVHVRSAVEALEAAGADVVGANCGRGVRCVAAAVKVLTAATDRPVAAYPNAGLPEYVDGRYLFGAPLPYLTDEALGMVQQGVNLIGGCCGTTPAYVARLAERLGRRQPAVRVRVPAALPDPLPAISTPPRPHSSVLSKREAGPLIIVELDPPRDLHYEPILRRAAQLRDMGVDAITMGDNTVATLRMGNMALAHIVQEEIGLPVIVHLTCRDHNLLGLQSLLMAAHIQGLHHILALTGDPARVGDQPGATSVYDLNSFGLIELIARFNRGVNHAGMPLGKPTCFTIGVAFNPNGRNLAGQVQRLRKKVALGAHFAMTQPIYDLERYHQMRQATADLGIPIFAGVMPLLSQRNAEFVHNEVPGIVLSDEVRRRMQGLSGKAGRQMGLQICKELIDGMIATADGFYLIPPQTRTEMAVELAAHIQERLAAKVQPRAMP